MIEPCGVLADIGTDHGQLPLMVLKAGLADKVIATDISEGSLAKAETYRLFDCRLGDGLSVLKYGEADTVVIAGMGARTISKMLERDCGAKRYILSSQSEVGKFREFLNKNNFKIIKEETVSDRKHMYSIFVCERNI